MIGTSKKIEVRAKKIARKATKPPAKIGKGPGA
jgi:hypothetical protein